MRLRREHCFLLISWDDERERQILSDFLQKNLSVYKKNYDYYLRKVTFKLVKIYQAEDDRFIVPDGFLFRISSFLDHQGIPYTFEDEERKPLVAYWDEISHHSCRPLQTECLKAIDTVLQGNIGGVVIAPPAFGKSHLIALLCVLYKNAKIDIISRRRDVVLSLYQNVMRFTPDVGVVTSGKHVTGKRVTVYTAGSLAHSNFSADLVLLDEVHELVTDPMYRILSSYSAPKIGFTATADTRYDNMSIRIEGICGPQIYKVDYSTAEQVSLVVPIAVVWYPVIMPQMIYDDPISRKRYGIWNNETRNQIIADVARMHYNENRQTLVMVETIEHALALSKLLPEFELCYAGTGKEGKYPVGYQPIPPKKRDELRMKFMRREIKGAIATGVWSVGVSFNDLEVLIRAEGSGSRTAATQVPGRVCRISSQIKKPYGLVIDFVDGFDSVLANRSVERFREYAKHGWLQLDPDGNVIQTPKRLRSLTEPKIGKSHR